MLHGGFNEAGSQEVGAGPEVSTAASRRLTLRPGAVFFRHTWGEALSAASSGQPWQLHIQICGISYVCRTRGLNRQIYTYEWAATLDHLHKMQSRYRKKCPAVHPDHNMPSSSQKFRHSTEELTIVAAC